MLILSIHVHLSRLKKWVKKTFSGIEDPHEHVILFKRVLQAEEITDFHTQIEGFGLTLEGKALLWFQTLDRDAIQDINTLLDAFIVQFTERGIKNDTLSSIHQFKQGINESVKDAAYRLRTYITRCPKAEHPTQERLVSIFLDGLTDRHLSKDVYTKRCATLDQCIQEAVDLVENIDSYQDQEVGPENTSTSQPKLR